MDDDTNNYTTIEKPDGFIPMTFGEDAPEKLTKGKPVLAASNCPFCNHPVWVSSIGYSHDDPTIDIPVPSTEGRLNVHKQCIFFIFDLIMPAIAQNLRNKGQ